MAVRKTILFAEEPRIWYGDKVYMLMPVARQSYHSLFCTVCGNSRKITITGRDGHGYTYPCPECAAGEKERKNTLTLFRYEVQEFIVQSITISGPDTMASYPRYRRAEDDGTEAKEKDYPAFPGEMGFLSADPETRGPIPSGSMTTRGPSNRMRNGSLTAS